MLGTLSLLHVAMFLCYYVDRKGEAIQMQAIIDRLVEIGGNEWQKGDHHRIYINNLAVWYGLEYTTYNTGNISSAKVDGEKISNSSARKILGGLSLAKVWYDVNTGKIQHKGLSETAQERIIPAIMNAAGIADIKETA